MKLIIIPAFLLLAAAACGESGPQPKMTVSGGFPDIEPSTKPDIIRYSPDLELDSMPDFYETDAAPEIEPELDTLPDVSETFSDINEVTAEISVDLKPEVLPDIPEPECLEGLVEQEPCMIDSPCQGSSSRTCEDGFWTEWTDCEAIQALTQGSRPKISDNKVVYFGYQDTFPSNIVVRVMNLDTKSITDLVTLPFHNSYHLTVKNSKVLISNSTFNPKTIVIDLNLEEIIFQKDLERCADFDNEQLICNPNNAKLILGSLLSTEQFQIYDMAFGKIYGLFDLDNLHLDNGQPIFDYNGMITYEYNVTFDDVKFLDVPGVNPLVSNGRIIYMSGQSMPECEGQIMTYNSGILDNLSNLLGGFNCGCSKFEGRRTALNGNVLVCGNDNSLYVVNLNAPQAFPLTQGLNTQVNPSVGNGIVVFSKESEEDFQTDKGAKLYICKLKPEWTN